MAVRGKLKDDGVTRGDQFSVRRNLRLTPGVSITEGWLTVKAAVADADPGVFQKVITTTNLPGTGQIEDPGTDGFAVVRFDISEANTLGLTADQQYLYDMQIRTDETPNQILTFEAGAFTPTAQITIDS